MTINVITIAQILRAVTLSVFFIGIANLSAKADEGGKQSPLLISESALYDKIYGGWLGQMVGNIYGLPHENIYIDEPGPEAFPYGYDFKEVAFYPHHFGTGFMTGVLEALGGSFSDDDTDIEYVYLNLMEKVGTEPTYAHVKEAWEYHIRDWVWLANRAALGLMVYGYTPPATGHALHNPHWFEIDPQLINEVWALTAPGMVTYAAGKSAWGARITSEGWATEPTIHYGAMYAAAFFESDIEKLIDIGTAALPQGSTFAETVAFVKSLHGKYPNDWKAARKELADKFYHGAEKKSIWNANLNGAAAIMALLYGEGDVQKTLDYACAIGFDADNQAASMIGLLGVVYGRSGLPDDLLMPIEGWQEPFNDRYVNRSRFGLPNESIKNMAKRSLAVAEKIILEKGGAKEKRGHDVFYRINSQVEYQAPLELNGEPVRVLTRGEDVSWSLYSGGYAPAWRILEGALPPGISFSSGRFSGQPTKEGTYSVTLQVKEGNKTAQQDFDFIVRGANLAATAQKVMAPSLKKDVELNLLRDGKSFGAPSLESEVTADARRVSFGYEWASPQKIGSAELVTGVMKDNGGWFTSLTAEYLSEEGRWLPVHHVHISPEPSFENSPFAHPPYAAYRMSFSPIETRGLRVSGLTGGVGNSRFVSVSEVGVYGPIPPLSDE